jgi:hypothetical protein
MGMVSLLLAMAAWLASLFLPGAMIVALGAILFATFALSVVFAMFYKIIPFLVWFHLNAQGYYTAPMMHEVIHPRTAKKHFWIHTAVVALFLLALFVPVVTYLAGVMMSVSFAWVAWQIAGAHRLYLHTQRTGEKFEMPTAG